jgi:hypothetical protein
MTKPRTDKLLLIPAAYLSLSPVAPVLPTFSDPARSTRCMTDSFYLFFPPYSTVCLNYIDMMVCARDDEAFMAVAATERFLLPSSIFFSMLS